jgi:hypothetical protein
MPPPRKKSPRVRPTIAQQKQLLIETRGACGWCRRTAASYDFHHIDEDPSYTVLENLITLCGTCHDGARLGNPSQADLSARKRELVWARAAAACHVDPTSPVKKLKFVARENHGPVQQAETINNHYRTPKRPTMAPAPDSIGAYAAERSYLNYLREEYIRCRLLEQRYGDRRKFVPAQASNAIKKALGYAPLQAPIASFDTTWRKLHEVVCATLGARKYQNGFRPHEWAEHQRRMATEASA